jgi:hypothetical protein
VFNDHFMVSKASRRPRRYYTPNYENAPILRHVDCRRFQQDSFYSTMRIAESSYLKDFDKTTKRGTRRILNTIGGKVLLQSLVLMDQATHVVRKIPA